MRVKKIDDYRFNIEKDTSSGMNTGVVMYSSEKLMANLKNDRTMQQAANAATLPGIRGNVMVMPDGHEGYGFPVGGVAGFDSDEGIISPGAIGFDINCGIRVIRTNLEESDIRKNMKRLSDEIFSSVPSGLDSRLKAGFELSDLEKVAHEGAAYLVSKGFGVHEDIEHMEENGCMEGADFSKVSQRAKSRGKNQLGTLGAGNHFLEIQKIDKIFDKRLAKAYGVYEGQIVIMVHTGSRGFGHQICSDYLRTLAEYQARKGIKIVDPELSYAHVKSKEADDYLKAMKCGVNFAFANREMITHIIRESFEKVMGRSAEELGMSLLYDLSHNIAKLEEHKVDGKREAVYVHRKGATRAFAKGRKEIPEVYRDYGQPVLIPGSMGTASYILAGGEGAMEETFGSACHGAGRVMSRHQALREIGAEKTMASMKSKDIELRVHDRRLVSEESEWVYKDIDEVIRVVEGAGLAAPVSRNVPIAVIKG
ncbi:MAG: RtcB family protein [Candidatus Marsarchaeota archaeon]|jgi:tRNA-splicing ligase RtcB|nr:RtcB family protein [Candidatus Marsarchaeota archaeon]